MSLPLRLSIAELRERPEAQRANGRKRRQEDDDEEGNDVKNKRTRIDGYVDSEGSALSRIIGGVGKVLLAT